MPARHIDSIHDRYELQPTPRCQSSTSLSCSFTSGGWREGWGAEEPGGGRRVLNFIILPRGGGAASCCCCSLLPAPTEPLPTPALSSQAGPSWHWRGFYFIPCHQLSSDISAHWTDRHFSATKTLPPVSRTRWRNVMFSYRDVGVKVHCCSFVFILVCSQQRAVWAGPSCIPGSDSRPPPGRSSPAQPLPSRQCFLRTRSHLLTSDRGFKFLTNTFPETFIVKQSYSQNIFNSNLS